MIKFIQTILIMIVATCVAVIVILTAVNYHFFCDITNNRYILCAIILAFTVICGISFYIFVKLWNSMFLK